ncbi:TPA: biphenyl hydrolase-like [Bos taurus]|nr:TPA: biphenyl hydrolase-like [Bos taurus]
MAAALGSRAARRMRHLLSALKPGIQIPRAGPAAAFGSSVTSAKAAVNGVHLHYLRTGGGEHAVLLLPGMLVKITILLTYEGYRAAAMRAVIPPSLHPSKETFLNFSVCGKHSKTARCGVSAGRQRDTPEPTICDMNVSSRPAVVRRPLSQTPKRAYSIQCCSESGGRYVFRVRISRKRTQRKAERPALCGSPGFARPARPSPAPASLPSTVAPTGFCIHPDPESLPSTATPTSCCIHPAPVSLPSTATPTGCCTHDVRWGGFQRLRTTPEAEDTELLWAEREGLRRTVSCLAGSICRDLLPLVQCPTLIVHGEKDPLVPRFHADFLHRHVRGSRLHLMPEGKHNLHLRFADEFNRLAEGFLQ